MLFSFLVVYALRKMSSILLIMFFFMIWIHFTFNGASREPNINNFKGTRKALLDFILKYSEYSNENLCGNNLRKHLDYDDVDDIYKQLINEKCSLGQMKCLLEDIFRTLIKESKGVWFVSYESIFFHRWRKGRENDQFIESLVENFYEMLFDLLKELISGYKRGITYPAELNRPKSCWDMIKEMKHLGNVDDRTALYIILSEHFDP